MSKQLPGELQSRLNIILGKNYSGAIEAFSHERKGSFRINTLKGDGSDVLQEFTEKGITIEPMDGLEGIYTFDRVHEYAIKGTRGFYDGKIYLQSIASMLPVLALAPERGDSILDVCAAPGSKTTQLSAMMDNIGSITAIEQNQIRYDKLMHNIRIQGATNIKGVKMDARKFLMQSPSPTPFNKNIESGINTHELFDRILIDAPCSAEGRIHTDNEKSYGFWSIANILNKSELQYELISLAYMNLREGGTLVYSTCTLAPEENEGVIQKFILNHPDASIENIDIGFSQKKWWSYGMNEFDGEKYDKMITKTIRILPSDETEGFFITKIYKKNTSNT